MITIASDVLVRTKKQTLHTSMWGKQNTQCTSEHVFSLPGPTSQSQPERGHTQ